MKSARSLLHPALCWLWRHNPLRSRGEVEFRLAEDGSLKVGSVYCRSHQITMWIRDPKSGHESEILYAGWPGSQLLGFAKFGAITVGPIRGIYWPPLRPWLVILALLAVLMLALVGIRTFGATYHSLESDGPSMAPQVMR